MSEALTIVAAIFSLTLLIAFGSSFLYLHINKIFKKALVFFIFIESFILLINMIVLIIARFINYGSKEELLVNFDLAFIIADLMLLSLFMMWINTKEKYDVQKKINKKSKIVMNVFNSLSYAFMLITWILFIAITACGIVFVKYNIYGFKDALFNYVFPIVRVLFIVFASVEFISLCLYLIFSSVEFKKAKKKVNFYNTTKVTCVSLGYLIAMIVLIYTSVALFEYKVNDSWWQKMMDDLFNKSYINELSYIPIYLSIVSVLFVTIWYVPQLKDRKDKKVSKRKAK